jgi:uncharacterized protein YndB with AHSA1/START domain
MTRLATLDHHAVLTDATTLRIERLLPGPIERIWQYLTDGDLRQRWFAAGDMTMEVGAPVELVWRNDELTNPPGNRPASASGENRMQSRVLELEPLRKLAIAWGANGASVTFELEPRDRDVLLTIVHRGVPDRASALNFGPGWHAHLDILQALLTGATPRPFWDEIARLRGEYESRLVG